MKKRNGFVVRVYGILINEKQEVLLSDEIQFDTKMTKFPGGGLEHGEGTIDCLKREAIEELGQEVEIVKHLYTTDFFQEAFFYDGMQLISIYYQIKLKKKQQFKTTVKVFDFQDLKNESLSFRWKSITKLSKDELTFPIDKLMVTKIKAIIADRD